MCTGRDIFWDQNFCPICLKHWVHCYCHHDTIEEAGVNDTKEVYNDERSKQKMPRVYGKWS